MENWLASGQEINGVAANNDEMALGALQAIKAAGKLGKISVFATRLSLSERCRYVQNFLFQYSGLIGRTV
jgi:ABC-type sugar transport system substrate-binding protein